MRSSIGFLFRRPARSDAAPHAWMKRAAVLLMAGLGLSGCGLVALPFRVTGDVLQVVPVVGDAAAVPFDAVGDAID